MSIKVNHASFDALTYPKKLLVVQFLSDTGDAMTAEASFSLSQLHADGFLMSVSYYDNYNCKKQTNKLKFLACAMQAVKLLNYKLLSQNASTKPIWFQANLF